jgi:hypothetical protein
MKANIGFTMALIGMAGLAEAYGSASKITISLLLVIVGGVLIHRGLTDEKQNIGGTYDSINRPYYLPRG